MVKPVIVKEGMNDVEEYALNYSAATHPQNNPVEWKELMRFWKINRTTLELNQAPISAVPTVKHEDSQTVLDMISKEEAKQMARDYALNNPATVLKTRCVNCDTKEAELCKECHPNVPQFDARQAQLYPSQPATLAPSAPPAPPMGRTRTVEQASSSNAQGYTGHSLNFGSAYSPNAATSYPFCWDGRRLTCGKNKGKRFWDVTADDPDYCTWIIQEVADRGRLCSPAMRECQKYLLDRGYPFMSAPLHGR